MGTRHLIFIYYQGRFAIAQYGQWDGYPEGQGFTILAFIRDPTNITRLKEGLNHIHTPTDTELEQLYKEIDVPDENGIHFWGSDVLKKAWPSLSRDAGAKILEIIAQATAEKRVPVVLDSDFVYDGLFCEWAYVIDLDDKVLEVFQSTETKRESSSQRFKDVEGKGGGRVPALIKSFSFSELPATNEEFIAVMNEGLERRKIREGKLPKKNEIEE